MKHEPASIEWMTTTSPLLTICEVLRGIYHEADSRAIKEQARLACGMAKDMSKTISALKGNDEWMAEYWDANPNYGAKS